MNLFTINRQIVIHKATGSDIIAIRDYWAGGVQYVDCAVPQINEKGKLCFANATYSVDEIIMK